MTPGNELSLLTEVARNGPLAIPFIILVLQVREMTKAMGELGDKMKAVHQNREDLMTIVKDNTIAMTTVAEILRQLRDRKRSTDAE